MRPLPPPITSRTNARVKALRAAFTGRASEPGEWTGLEGQHLLAEAALAGIGLETIFVREGDEALLEQPGLRGLRAREVAVLSREVFGSVVETATPQGVAATLAIPAQPAEMGLQGEGPVLILEEIQDPGNLGTLIRSAAAFGTAQVLLLGSCANAWSPKVLRSSAGSMFRVPVARVGYEEALQQVHLSGRRLLAAVVGDETATAANRADLCRAAVMIGNEGQGLSRRALALADGRVTIPCRVESLNAAVAGSLLLYEASRQASEAIRAKGRLRDRSPALAGAAL